MVFNVDTGGKLHVCNNSNNNNFILACTSGEIAWKLVVVGQDKYVNNTSTKNKNTTLYKALKIVTWNK